MSDRSNDAVSSEKKTHTCEALPPFSLREFILADKNCNEHKNRRGETEKGG